MTLSAGDRLGRYEILGSLGAGGMGEVYRARDTGLERDVAVKVMTEKLARDQERVRRFEREARAAAAIDHPNILAIHDVGTHEGAPYIVSELLEGVTLRDRIAGGDLTVLKVVEYSIQVARGLDAAHSRGIVHRDLKPSNLFVTKDGHVKILDFGLAKLREPEEFLTTETPTATLQTSPGALVGTVAYMAPEQVKGREADHRSDIFSLGGVVYEMLTGRRPFRGATTAEVAAEILKGDAELVSAVTPKTPPELSSIVLRCLEKRPDDRFQSAHDLAIALRAIQEGAQSQQPGPEPLLRRRWPHALAVVIAAAIALIVVLPPEGIWQRLTGMDAERFPIRSIAILPLENLTGDPEQAYFVDGLHEELTATFAQISGFDKVIARTSVMGFRDSDTPVREIGKQLDVESVLEGSVRRSGNTVRTTVQLIDARTESHLWAETYEHDLTDILALQSEVARAVAGEVHVALTPQEEGRLSKTRLVEQEAYEAYLKAMNLIRSGRGPQETFVQAIGLFEAAIDIDPTFAPAYAGLSRSYLSLAVRYRPTIEVMPKAQEAVAKALELDEALPEAHTYLGHLKESWQWDWRGAESEFRRALELDPNNAEAMYGLAGFLGCIGRPEEAIEIQRRAVELDPLDLRSLYGLGWAYWVARRYDESIVQLRKTIALHPKESWPHIVLSWNHGHLGQYDDALENLHTAAEIDAGIVRDPFYWMSVTWVNAMAGRTMKANNALERLFALREDGYLPPTYVAYAYIGLGDLDRAIEWLERAFEARHLQITCLAIPSLDPVRQDPRFQDIMRRINFPKN